MIGNFRYDDYMTESSDFFKKKVFNSRGDFAIDSKHDLSNWTVKSDVYEYWKTYTHKNKEMPNQGWKIHISTAYEDAERVLDIVSDILLERGVNFKHVNNKRTLHSMYSKTGNRLVTGKFITIYPTETDFLLLLDELYELLKEFPKGPYILTDKPWKDSNVYYRYGAFKKIINGNGEYCIYDNDGNLVPDKREPKFYVPPFVEIPKEVKKAEQEFESQQTNEIQTENQLKKYEIKKAITFSNSGGVYLASQKKDDMECVIKEARLNVGLDGMNKTAADRLNIEYKALLVLSEVPEVVNAIDYFKVWDSTFLCLEYMKGTPLIKWVEQEFPFSKNEDIDIYFQKVMDIITQLEKALLKIHAKEIAFCDLQPRNIIIGDDLRVRVIDFETAKHINDESVSALKTRGFSNPNIKKANEKDWYALNRVFQYCLLPLNSLFDLSVEINIRHCLWIFENYGIENYSQFHKKQMEIGMNITNFDSIFEGTYQVSTKIIEENAIQKRTTISDFKMKLINGLLSNCDENTETLINGNVIQLFANYGKLNIINGGFGAVWALAQHDALSESIHVWIKDQIPRCISDNSDNGYLTGRSGISCVLYECGYYEESLKIIRNVLEDYDKSMNDLSLKSGLAGIALSFLFFYKKTRDAVFLKEAKRIASELESRFNQMKREKWIIDNHIQFGLMDGYSGISLVFTSLNELTNKENYLQTAVGLINDDYRIMEIASDSLFSDSEQTQNFLKTYITSCEIGILIAINYLKKSSEIKEFDGKFATLTELTTIRVDSDSSFYSGAGGLFLAHAISSVVSLEEIIDRLSVFTVEDKTRLFFPAKMFYKLSSDFQTGSSGILLGIKSAEEKNPLACLPM